MCLDCRLDLRFDTSVSDVEKYLQVMMTLKNSASNDEACFSEAMIVKLQS